MLKDLKEGIVATTSHKDQLGTNNKISQYNIVMKIIRELNKESLLNCYLIYNLQIVHATNN